MPKKKKIENMHHLLKVGDVLKGYCGGFFGRDDYEDKTALIVVTKFAVLGYKNGNAVVMNFSELGDTYPYSDVEKWLKGK